MAWEHGKAVVKFNNYLMSHIEPSASGGNQMCFCWEIP